MLVLYIPYHGNLAMKWEGHMLSVIIIFDTQKIVTFILER